MSNLKTAFAISALALSSCAVSQPAVKQTQSGHPEGVFKNESLEVVKGKLIEACGARSWTVFEAGSNQVVCGKTMEGGSAILTQLAIGNSYSTTPQQKIRFTVFQLNADVKVTSYQWVETQMAFGQTKTQELNSTAQNNSVQNMLFQIGAE